MLRCTGQAFIATHRDSFLAALDTLLAFFVERLRNARRPALVSQGQYGDFRIGRLPLYMQGIALLDGAGRLDALAVQVDLAAVDGGRCQAAGLLEAGCPQPLVNAHCFRVIAWHGSGILLR